MNKIGTFKILDSFKITGRRRIAAGQILDGIVKPGCYSYLEIDEKSVLCRITGVDLGKLNSKGDSLVGLSVFNQEVNLENYLIKEQVIVILEPIAK